MRRPSFPLLSMFALVAALSCSDVSNPLSNSETTLSDEFALLFWAERFYPACIGYFEPAVSPHARAYRAILADPRADEHFKRLLLIGGSPARVYGLAGIFYTDPKTFADVLPQYLRSGEQVIYANSDALIPRTLSQMAADIESGQIPESLKENDCVPDRSEIGHDQHGPHSALVSLR